MTVLVGSFLDFRKEIVAFALECLIANSKDLVKDQYVSLCLNRHRKSKADLHTGRIILQFLIHELFEFSEFDDVVVHRIDFFMRESQKRAI